AGRDRRGSAGRARRTPRSRRAGGGGSAAGPACRARRSGRLRGRRGWDARKGRARRATRARSAAWCGILPEQTIDGLRVGKIVACLHNRREEQVRNQLAVAAPRPAPRRLHPLLPPFSCGVRRLGLAVGVCDAAFVREQPTEPAGREARRRLDLAVGVRDASLVREQETEAAVSPGGGGAGEAREGVPVGERRGGRRAGERGGEDEGEGQRRGPAEPPAWIGGGGHERS